MAAFKLVHATSNISYAGRAIESVGVFSADRSSCATLGISKMW